MSSRNFLWEEDVEENVEVSTLLLLIHIVACLVDGHTLTFNAFYSLGSYYLIHRQHDRLVTKQWDLHRLALDRFLQCDSVSVVEVTSGAFEVETIAARNVVILCCWMRVAELQLNKEVRWLVPRLLVSFALECERCHMIHPGLDLNALVGGRILNSLTIQTDHLLVVTHSFDAATVDFFEGCG